MLFNGYFKSEAAWLSPTHSVSQRSQTWELPAGQSHTEGHLYNFPVLFFTILMRNMQQNIHQIDTDGGTVYLSNVFLCQRDDYWKFGGRHASWLLDWTTVNVTSRAAEQKEVNICTPTDSFNDICKSLICLWTIWMKSEEDCVDINHCV